MGDNMESLEGGCVIVANGRFPSAELPLRLLKEAKTIIACDGAVKTLYEKGIHPDAIVGDLDSIPAGLRERYADRIHHVEDQETTTSPNPSVSPMPKAIKKFLY